MHNDHVAIREIGSTRATCLRTMARQLAAECGSWADLPLVAQGPEFIAAPLWKTRTQCQVVEAGALRSQWVGRRKR